MSFKTWFRAGVIAVLSLTLASTIAVAQGNGHGHDKDKHDRGDDDDRDEHGHGHGKGHEKHEHERYSDHNRDIHEWYRAHYSHLPPGLAKRDRLPPGLERQLVVNGTLPPGLRGKMQPCPHELETYLPPPAPGFAHVVIGGNLVLMNRASFQIVDVFHFSLN
jgi:Ni/Co efflux regulator RcnB